MHIFMWFWTVNVMKQVEKGKLGYLKYRRTTYGLYSLVGFVIMFCFMMMSIMMYASLKAWPTIVGIIAILPTAKFFVQYLMIPKKSLITSEELKELNDLAHPGKIYADLFITASEKGYHIPCVYIDDAENIIAYTPDLKADKDKFRSGVTNFLNYYNYSAVVTLVNDIDALKSKIEFVKLGKQSGATGDGSDSSSGTDGKHANEVFEKLSIMCI